MIARLTVERALWALTCTLATVSAVTLTRAPASATDLPASERPIAMPAPADADTLAAAADRVIGDNLFRADRSSVDAAANPIPVTNSIPAPSTKPRLVLRGILGGPPWDALVDGVPGHDGALVIRAGQSIAGLTVRAVRRDTVFIRGFDTTWALALGRH